MRRTPALRAMPPALAPSCLESLARRSRRLLPAACLLAFGLAPQTSLAADPGDASPRAIAPVEDERVVMLNEEGSELYAAGDYRRAVERFLEAYAVDQDPNLLFNIASCYEALGDIDAALEKYRAFLSALNADPEGRPRAQQAIERLMALDGPSPRESLAPPAEPEPRAALAPVVAADTLERDAAWLPWAGLAGGAALGALGATFYLMGAADHADVTDSPGFDDPDAVASITRDRADALIRAGDTKKAIGATTASVGAALIVGSVVWWLVDPLKPASSSSGLEVSSSSTQIRYRGVF